MRAGTTHRPRELRCRIVRHAVRLRGVDHREVAQVVEGDAVRRTSVGLPPSETEAMTNGAGLPLEPSTFAPNFTTVFGEFALLDQRLPAVSKAKRPRPGNRMIRTLQHDVRRERDDRSERRRNDDASNSSSVEPALFATHRLPDDENAMPSGPEKAGLAESCAFGTRLKPPVRVARRCIRRRRCCRCPSPTSCRPHRRPLVAETKSRCMRSSGRGPATEFDASDASWLAVNS